MRTTFSEQSVIDQTECWVRSVVVGLNLCPFAANPLRDRKVLFEVCRASEPATIYKAILAEMAAFIELPATRAETALFIVPYGLATFETYLEVLDEADRAIEQVGLSGVLQLASFHPDYRFADAPADDPANYSNRSPHPMFHLIREELMEQALRRYPDPEQIPQRNIEQLRRLGAAAMHERLQRCRGQ